MAAKNEVLVSSSVVEVMNTEPKSPKSSWKGWLWDSADVSKEERRFLLKVRHYSRSSNCKIAFLTTSHPVGLYTVDLWNSWYADQMGKYR